VALLLLPYQEKRYSDSMRVSSSYSAPSLQHLRVAHANTQQPQAQQAQPSALNHNRFGASSSGGGFFSFFNIFIPRSLPTQIGAAAGAVGAGLGTFFGQKAAFRNSANRIARGLEPHWFTKLPFARPNDATKASLQKFNTLVTRSLPTTHNVTKVAFVGTGATAGYVGGATVAEMHGLVEGQNAAVKAVGTAAGAIAGNVTHNVWWQQFRPSVVRKSVEQLNIGKWIKPERY
jgi:uncharacterized membrane protein